MGRHKIESLITGQWQRYTRRLGPGPIPKEKATIGVACHEGFNLWVKM